MDHHGGCTRPAVLDLAGRSLQEQQAAFALGATDLDSAVVAADAQLAERRAATAIAGEVLRVADEGVAAKQQERDAAQAKAEASEREHAKFEQACTKKTTAWAQFREGLGSAVAVCAAAKTLADGTSENVEEQVASVEAFLTEIRAEKVLVASATIALAVAAEDRSHFDRMTVQYVLEVVEAKVAELHKRMAEIEPEERELKAELLGMWAIAEVDRDATEAAELKLIEAQGVQRRAAKALKDAGLEERATQEAKDTHTANRAAIDVKVMHLDAALRALERVLAGEVAPAEAPAADVEMESVEAATPKTLVAREEAQVACAGA